MQRSGAAGAGSSARPTRRGADRREADGAGPVGPGPGLTKHALVREALLELIRRDPTHGRSLPSERELAASYGVSRMTARQAIEELVDEGYVYRVQGAGTFVHRPAISKSLTLTSFSEDMRARGMRPGSRILRVEERPAGPAAGRDLLLSPVEPVVSASRVRLADGTPMCLERVELPARLVPGITPEDFEGSLYALLAARYRIRVVRADQGIRATVLHPEEADLLGVPPLSPALLVRRVTADRGGRPVERAQSLYRADRYDFQVSVERKTARTSNRRTSARGAA